MKIIDINVFDVNEVLEFIINKISITQENYLVINDKELIEIHYNDYIIRLHTTNELNNLQDIINLKYMFGYKNFDSAFNVKENNLALKKLRKKDYKKKSKTNKGYK